MPIIAHEAAQANMILHGVDKIISQSVLLTHFSLHSGTLI